MSSDRFACIEYNITNSSWHFGPYGSLWTGLSHTTCRSINCHMDLSAMNYLINNNSGQKTCGAFLSIGVLFPIDIIMTCEIRLNFVYC
jgi:hypothetical protein